MRQPACGLEHGHEPTDPGARVTDRDAGRVWQPMREGDAHLIHNRSALGLQHPASQRQGLQPPRHSAPERERSPVAEDPRPSADWHSAQIERRWPSILDCVLEPQTDDGLGEVR